MTKRFKVEIERNNQSACILDTETSNIYLLVRFKRFDKQSNREAYIHNLYEVCEVLNELNKENLQLKSGSGY